MNLTDKKWSPYIVGGGIGTLIWLTIMFLQRNLGNSSALVSIGTYIKSFFVSYDSIALSKYHAEFVIKKPIFDMQSTVILGIFLGAYLSAYLSKSTVKFVPEIWEKRLGSSKIVRAFFTFIGGCLVGFGARLADGCMSGLGLSSGIKLATVAWIFLVAVFVGGIVVSFIVYQPWRK